jgi:rhomboid protease GluP
MAEPRIHTWITYALIAANLAMFGVELAMGADPVSPKVVDMIAVGANFPPLTFEGEWWRLGTSMFLHFGLLHLALNMVCLWQGRVVETLFGRGAFTAIYLLAGLAGGVASLARGGIVVSAGASGAVFGVYGAFGAFLVLRKATMPEAVWQQTARGIGLFVVINFIFGLTVPSISMTAHVGGLVVGFLVGLALLWRGAVRPGIARTLAVAVGGAALVVAALFVIPKPESGAPAITKFDAAAQVIEAKWPELVRRHRAGELDDTRAATELARDVLGPWRMHCSALAASPVEGRYQALHQALLDYCEVRDASWETFLGALRATGNEKVTMLERHAILEVEVRRQAFAVIRLRQAR